MRLTGVRCGHDVYLLDLRHGNNRSLDVRHGLIYG